MRTERYLSPVNSSAHNSERLFNVLVAASVLSWGVLGWHRAYTVEGMSVVRVCISVLHIAVAACFVLRSTLIKSGSAMSVVVSLPSLVLCGVAFRLAGVPSKWPDYAEALFVAGTLLALWSILTLGRSFAVLPALRSVIAVGPYRCVRHPMYVGELLLVAACFFAGPSWLASVPAIAIVPSVVLRIVAEERTLLTANEYRHYASRVKWRLVPGLW